MSEPSDNEKKRRLPTWMLGVCATDKQIKDGNTDGRFSSLEEQPNPQAIDLKVKPVNRKHDRFEISKDISESKVLAEGRNSTRRTGKRSRKAENKDIAESEVLEKSHKSTRRNSKRCRKAEGMFGVGEVGSVKKNEESAGCWRTRHGEAFSSITQKRKYTGQKNSKGEATLEESEDDVELTVDDLIDIAREYVNANKEHSRARTHTSEVQVSSLSFFSKTDSALPLPSNESIKHNVSSCSRLTSGSHSNDFSKEQGIAASKDTYYGTAKSGDVAQDMLDLFLGPLLRKTSSTSRDDKISETEGVVATFETHKQLNSKETLKEEVPITKKKSSLKDKVAMFLQ